MYATLHWCISLTKTFTLPNLISHNKLNYLKYPQNIDQHIRKTSSTHYEHIIKDHQHIMKTLSKHYQNDMNVLWLLSKHCKNIMKHHCFIHKSSQDYFLIQGQQIYIFFIFAYFNIYFCIFQYIFLYIFQYIFFLFLHISELLSHK